MKFVEYKYLIKHLKDIHNPIENVYIICNKKHDKKDIRKLILGLINNNAYKLDFYGKYSRYWEFMADDTVVRYFYDGKDFNCNLGLTCSYSELDDFSFWIYEYTEYYEKDSPKDTSFILYDDIKILNKVLKNVEKQKKEE